MSIPEQVHPIKLIMALFGLDPRKPRPKFRVVVQILCHALEIPPIRALQALDDLKAYFAPLAAKAESPETFLCLDSVIQDAAAKAKLALGPLIQDDGRELLENAGEWVNSKLRVDSDTMTRLLTFTLGKLRGGSHFPGQDHPALVVLDDFCDGLINAAPTGFAAAHRALRADLDTAMTLRGHLQRFQGSIRPLHRLVLSERGRESGDIRTSVTDLLLAWASAAETSIYTISRFVWLVKGYPASLTKDLPGGRTPQKGNIFNLAADWCDQNSVPFPFRRDLYKLRNSISHEYFTITDSEINFEDSEGNIIATLNLDDDLKQIQQDIIVAANFLNAATSAEFRHFNHLGNLDEAWATAKSCIPKLEELVHDDGEPWPREPGFPRTCRRRVLSFRHQLVLKGRHFDRYRNI